MDSKEMDTNCPHCGHHFNAVRGLKDVSAPDLSDRPNPGAVSLCIECGEFAMFDENLKLRKFTPDEEVEILTDPGVKKARQAWMMMDAKQQQREKSRNGPNSWPCV